jgi:hypothetical protein
MRLFLARLRARPLSFRSDPHAICPVASMALQTLIDPLAPCRGRTCLEGDSKPARQAGLVSDTETSMARARVTAIHGGRCYCRS